MTDTTTPATEAAPAPTVAQTIERMVASSAAANPMPPVTIREGKTQESLIFNSATKALTTGDGSPPPAEPAAPITDTNIHEQQVSFEKIGADFQRVLTKLDEGTFDPRTGEKVYAVTGDARTRLLWQASQYQQAGVAVRSTIAKLTQQDAAADVVNAQRNAELQARRAYSGGDPRRAALFNEAMERAMAEEAVRLVIASKVK